MIDFKKIKESQVAKKVAKLQCSRNAWRIFYLMSGILIGITSPKSIVIAISAAAIFVMAVEFIKLKLQIGKCDE